MKCCKGQKQWGNNADADESMYASMVSAQFHSFQYRYAYVLRACIQSIGNFVRIIKNLL